MAWQLSRRHRQHRKHGTGDDRAARATARLGRPIHQSKLLTVQLKGSLVCLSGGGAAGSAADALEKQTTADRPATALGGGGSGRHARRSPSEALRGAANLKAAVGRLGAAWAQPRGACEHAGSTAAMWSGCGVL